MIKLVTITGADDSISPAKLVDLSLKYRFVEWGILVSKSQTNTPRFPSSAWMDELLSVQETNFHTMKLSLHLCGQWLRDLLLGDDNFIKRDYPSSFWPLFHRVQLNFHGQKHEINKSAFFEILKQYPGKEFIFQYENVNSILLLDAQEQSMFIKSSALFDLSHGAGLLPGQWPQPLPAISCGYAGGLSPDNLDEQIRKIESIVGDTPIWIDMETHVRSNMDQQFDLEKVEQCLQIASKYVRKE